MPRRETSRGFSLSSANQVVLSNSTNEADLLNEVIPGGKLGTNKKITLEILCTLTTPGISVPTGTIRVKFGSATLVLFNAVALAGSQTDTPFVIRVKIRNKDATNKQIVWGEIAQAANNLPMLLSSSMMSFAEWTQDTATDKTLSVTGQFGGLSLSTILTVRDVDLDLS